VLVVRRMVRRSAVTRVIRLGVLLITICVARAGWDDKSLATWNGRLTNAVRYYRRIGTRWVV
jgi:hypothetical protein